MPKRYFWIKFHTDFFQAPVVKKMRRMAGGDTFTIIYLKLQLLSVPDGGLIKLSGVEEDYCEELSLLLDEDRDNVQVTCMYLLKYGLLETLDNHTLFLPDASENIGTETESARRMRKLREKEKTKFSIPPSQCDVLASHCDAREEKRRKEKRRYREDIEKNENEAVDKLTASSDLIDEENDFCVFLILTAFEKLFEREPNKSFVSSIRKLAASGLRVGDAQEAILKAAKQNPRHPEPYIIAILKNLKNTLDAQAIQSNELAEWEKQWLDKVKSRKKQREHEIKQ